MDSPIILVFFHRRKLPFARLDWPALLAVAKIAHALAILVRVASARFLNGSFHLHTQIICLDIP